VTVPPAMRDRVETVGDRDNARLERNLCRLETAWIAGSVPSLVVSGDALCKLRIKSAERRQHFRSTQRMRHDGTALLGSELRRLMEDVGQSAVQLADVVEQCYALDAVQRSFIETGRLAEDERVVRDAPHMITRDGVVGIDCIEQCLHRRRAQAFGAAAHGVLAENQAACGGSNRNRDDVAHGTGVRKKCTVRNINAGR